MSIFAELNGFATQSRTEHAVVFLGGVAIFAATYFGTLALLGGIPLAAVESADALAARQIAIRSAAASCWLYFGVLFILARGGPLLNTVFYPLTLTAFGPALLPKLVLGTIPRHVFTTGERFTSPQFVADALSVTLPGAMLGIGLVLLWVYRLDPDVRTRWAATHLTPAFRKKFQIGSENQPR